MRFYIFIICLFGTIRLGFAQQQEINALATTSILPFPVVYDEFEGKLNYNQGFNFVGTNDEKLIYVRIKSLFFSESEIKSGTKPIQIECHQVANSISDYYELSIESTIKINYTSVASFQYALTSFFQLVAHSRATKHLSYCHIIDYPKFSWRGLHLDVSRHFFTVDEIKRLLDEMSFYKLNKFHWHLTDDQGWRIEIKSFPKLTSIGAYRDSTVIGHANSQPNRYVKEQYGGFYTQEQIKEVIAYAQKLQVEVIPEIEMPGHARAALAAYPEMGCSGKQLPVESLWGVFEDIYCTKKESISFNQQILAEVVSLFPSKYIHIGGDEAPKTNWEKCTACQKTMNEHHLRDAHELQAYFIRQMDLFLTSKGKILIGWDEILEGGLSDNAVVMSWRGAEGGIKAAELQHHVIMSPTEFCYFDHCQSRSIGEPLAIGGYLPLEKVYQFNPIPNELGANNQSYILGAQANLWTEYIVDFKQLEYMLFPRAIAMAQVTWSGNKQPFDQFQDVLIQNHLPFLTSKGIHFSHSFLIPTVKTHLIKGGIGLTITTPIQDEQFKVLAYSNNQLIWEKFVSRIDTIPFLRINQQAINEIVLKIERVTTGYGDTLTFFRFNQTNSLGVPIEWITNPAAAYSFEQQTLLVDGRNGTKPWRGDEWLGFNEDTIKFRINLDELKTKKTISFHFLEDQGSWIYYPNEIQLIQKLTNGKAVFVNSKGGENIQIGLEENVQSIEIKILSETSIPSGLSGAGHVPWTFIDEIEVK